MAKRKGPPKRKGECITIDVDLLLDAKFFLHEMLDKYPDLRAGFRVKAQELVGKFDLLFHKGQVFEGKDTLKR